MADKGLSLRSLATEVGMSASRMSYCLNGERAFTVGEVERISAALGVSHWRLIKAAEDALKEERARRADVIAFPGGKPHVSDGMTDQEALDQMGANPLQHAASTRDYDSDCEREQ